jgi:hypothetical protein
MTGASLPTPVSCPPLGRSAHGLKNIFIDNECTHKNIFKGTLLNPENTKGGSIAVLLTSCLTGLESAE